MINSIESSVGFLKALADVNRMKIMSMLLKNESNLCVADISSKLNITQPATSQHIKILKYANLITSTKEGNRVFYRIDKEKLKFYKDEFDALFNYGMSDDLKNCQC